MNLFFREVTIRSEKAARELGYAPPVSIEQGLAELAAELRPLESGDGV
jgi:hypothetical protein